MVWWDLTELWPVNFQFIRTFRQINDFDFNLYRLMVIFMEVPGCSFTDVSMLQIYAGMVFFWSSMWWTTRWCSIKGRASKVSCMLCWLTCFPASNSSALNILVLSTRTRHFRSCRIPVFCKICSALIRLLLFTVVPYSLCFLTSSPPLSSNKVLFWY